MARLKAVPGNQASRIRDAAVVESVGVQSIVVGADLVLTITEDRRITLHEITRHGNRLLGTFDDVRDAWAAVDRIDIERDAQESAVAEAGSTEGLRAA